MRAITPQNPPSASISLVHGTHRYSKVRHKKLDFRSKPDTSLTISGILSKTIGVHDLEMSFQALKMDSISVSGNFLSIHHIVPSILSYS